VDPAVLQELLEREARDLPAHAVEGGQDHGVRRVVDDDVDARERLERRMLRPSLPMIRPFMSSDGRRRR
jgi:hypothetical protein